MSYLKTQSEALRILPLYMGKDEWTCIGTLPTYKDHTARFVMDTVLDKLKLYKPETKEGDVWAHAIYFEEDINKGIHLETVETYYFVRRKYFFAENNKIPENILEIPFIIDIIVEANL